MDFIEIEVLNWYAHNKRRDFKSPRWFALSNRILEDSSFFEFSDAEFKAWIYILCQASQANSAMVRIVFLHASRVCNIPQKIMRTVIDKLEKLQSIRVYERGTNVTLHNKTIHNRTIQNNNAHAEAFADFWFRYPRKVGKTKAGASYKKATGAGATPSEISEALENYLAHLKREKTESKFILHGSTFMNQWEDWKDPAHGSSEDFSQSSKESLLEVLMENEK